MAEQPDAAGSPDFRVESNNPAEAKSFFITQFRSFAQKHGWNILVSNEFELILEEWLTNVIGYGFRNVLDPSLSLELRANRTDALIQITDNGAPFNPLGRPDPDFTIPLEDRPIGGLGIFMVKKISDELNYEHRNGRNVVTIRKSLLSPALGRGKKIAGT